MSALLKDICKHILPYRIYYSLFELAEELRRLNYSIEKVDRNCRNLAFTVSSRDDERGSYAKKPSALSAHELSVFSQNGEDGMLLYVFSKIGTTNKVFVEFGVEDGRECNSANLSINHGWTGLLIDGSSQNVLTGRRYYEEMLVDGASRVKFLEAFITAENIDQLIAEQNISGEIDLLSIDIDGNDYWVWRAIEKVNPRVVVMEYNASLGFEDRLTIPYQSDFVWNSQHFPELVFSGASLALLNDLAEEKGYILIGCDTSGVNAVFIRKDVALGEFTAVPVDEAYYPHALRTARFGLEPQELAVKSLGFITPGH